MSTLIKELAQHNYNAFSSLVDGMNTNGTSSLEKFLKYAYVITKGTSTCNIASTLLNCLRIYGPQFRCSDKQKWAIAFGTAEKGIRIRTIVPAATVSTSQNGSGAHGATGRVSAPVNRNRLWNPETYNRQISLLTGNGYVSNVFDPTGIDIFDTVEFRKIDTKSETVSAMIVRSDGDMSRGRISVEAPVGKAFLGHHEKDIVKVGRNTFEILSVRKRGTA